MKTTCKYCVFSKKDENGKQVGCLQGKLEKYEKRGEAVLTEEGHYEILGRRCPTVRAYDSPWALETNKEEWLSKASEEARPTFDIIIVCKDGDLGNLIEKLKLAEKNNVISVAVVYRSGKFKHNEVVDTVKNNYTKEKWTVTCVFPAEKYSQDDQFYVYEYLRSKKEMSRFTGILTLEGETPSTFIDYFKKEFEEELTPILVMWQLVDHFNGAIFDTSVFMAMTNEGIAFSQENINVLVRDGGNMFGKTV